MLHGHTECCMLQNTDVKFPESFTRYLLWPSLSSSPCDLLKKLDKTQDSEDDKSVLNGKVGYPQKVNVGSVQREHCIGEQFHEVTVDNG